MLLASLRRSNVQLLLRLRLPPHGVISTQAPSYGPLQWADCQLPWITISRRVLWAIRSRGAFTLNIHVVLELITGWRSLRQCVSDIIMNSLLLSNRETPAECFFLNTSAHCLVKCLLLFTFLNFSSDFLEKKIDDRMCECVYVCVCGFHLIRL